MNCDPKCQHFTIGAAAARLWFWCCPNLALGCGGLPVGVWYSCHCGAHSPRSDDFGRDAASGVYQWPLVLFPFGAVVHSVTDGMMHLAGFLSSISSLRCFPLGTLGDDGRPRNRDILKEPIWFSGTRCGRMQSGVAMPKSNLCLVGFEIDGSM